MSARLDFFAGFVGGGSSPALPADPIEFTLTAGLAFLTSLAGGPDGAPPGLLGPRASSGGLADLSPSDSSAMPPVSWLEALVLGGLEAW